MKGSRSLLATSALLFLLGVLPNMRRADAQFEYGDPIDITVTAGESLTISFAADPAAAVAISFQQCGGDAYMSMDTMFNGTSVTTPNTITSKCTRVRGSSALLTDTAVFHDNLCAFQNSGTVADGYLEEDALLSSSNVDPDYITAEIYNPGTITGTAQVVLFSTTYPAPSKDEKIDRVTATPSQDGNTYTVDAVFQADGAENENFCSGDDGCAVAAYYIEVDNSDTDADIIFGTACQAREGVLMYEGYTGSGSTFDEDIVTDDDVEEVDPDDDAQEAEENDDAAAAAGAGAAAGGGRSLRGRDQGHSHQARALSTTAFELSACVEFPKNTAATYRLYVVVSPDTESSARVGYGLQDQLMYESGDIVVEEDADIKCPEIVEDSEENSGSRAAGLPGGFVGSLAPVRASSAMAAALAAAAAASRVAAAEL
eukprot:g9903.t1